MDAEKKVIEESKRVAEHYLEDPKDHIPYKSHIEAGMDLYKILEREELNVLEEKDHFKSQITEQDRERLMQEIGIVNCGKNPLDFWHIKDGTNMYPTRILRVENKKGKQFEIIEYTCWASGGCSRIRISHFPPDY